MKLESFWGRPMNPFYDPDKANDGGGYWQFEGGALYITEAGRPVTVEVWDSSCGEFGTRLGVVIQMPRRRWATDWGTMDSEIPGDDVPDQSVLSSAAGSMGVSDEDLGQIISEVFHAASLAAAWQLDAQEERGEST